MPLTPSPDQSFFRSLLDLALPFMVAYLLLFYIIFGEFVLGSFLLSLLTGSLLPLCYHQSVYVMGLRSCLSEYNLCRLPLVLD